MYERIRALYLGNRMTDAGLDSAVTKGWITEEQAAQLREEKSSSATASGTTTQASTTSDASS